MVAGPTPLVDNSAQPKYRDRYREQFVYKKYAQFNFNNIM